MQQIQILIFVYCYSMSTKTKKLIPKIKSDLVMIKKSPIHGKGGFALKDIMKGEKIADYYGTEMKWKAFTQKYGPYKLNSTYTYPMRRCWRIIVSKNEPYRSKNISNFLNEIKGKSNCELKLRALYAKKNIKKGDELLLEYPRDYYRPWLKNKTKKKK